MSAQGAADIVSFHLDRILGFGRKPPITGRILTNKQLYFDNSRHSSSFFSFSSMFIAFAIVRSRTDRHSRDRC